MNAPIANGGKTTTTAGWADAHMNDRFRLSKQQDAGQAGKNQNKRYAQEALMHGVFSKPQNRQKPSVPTGFYTDRP